jgi:RNase P/RNase MRP subunit p29
MASVKIITLAVSLVILAGEVQPRIAAGRSAAQSETSNFTLEGKITAQHERTLTINTEQNIVFHVRYDEQTKMERKDGAAATSQDLKVGEKVQVEGELSETGEIYAHQITIE